MKVKSVIKDLRDVLSKNIKEGTTNSSNNVNKMVIKSLRMLDTDKHDKLLSELNKIENDDIRLLVRENLLFAS